MTLSKTLDLVLNVHKPVGLTSYDVVRRAKRVLPGVKIGHGGTLDPFAEGVLLILIGKATKRMSELLGNSKSYEARLKLGEATATGDNTSPVILIEEIPEISENLLRELELQFTGDIMQIPPAYSAKKVNGKPAYKYAREGRQVQLDPVQVSIYGLKLTKIENNIIKIKVSCSSGTYIRTLGENLAQAIGTVGHLVSLERVRIGEYTIENSIPVNILPEVITGFIAEA